MRLEIRVGLLLLACAFVIEARGARPNYGIDQAVALALAQNPEVIAARKEVEAARGNLLSARSGYLPSIVSTGLLDKREHQQETQLRDEDYNASLRLLQKLYTGG